MGAGALWHKQPRFKTSVVFFLLDQGKRKKKVQLCTTKVLARRKGCLISGGVLKVKYISLNIQHIFSRTVVRSLRGHIGVMDLPLMKDL